MLTTSTWPTTSARPARKKRAVDDDAGEKGGEEINEVDEEGQEASSSDCDTGHHDDVSTLLQTIDAPWGPVFFLVYRLGPRAYLYGMS